MIRRKMLGLTQEQVAHMCGYNASSTVTDWELGKKPPSLENILKLSEIFDCDINELIHGEAAVNVVHEPAATYGLKQESVFDRMYKSLDESHLRNIRNLEATVERLTVELNDCKRGLERLSAG